MPLAKYITEFQALDRKAQATAVIRGEYSKDQLTKLYKYATSATVRDTIDDMINHGELELNKNEQPDWFLSFRKDHSHASQKKLVSRGAFTRQQLVEMIDLPLSKVVREAVWQQIRCDIAQTNDPGGNNDKVFRFHVLDHKYRITVHQRDIDGNWVGDWDVLVDVLPTTEGEEEANIMWFAICAKGDDWNQRGADAGTINPGGETETEVEEVTPQPIARQDQNATTVAFSLNFESLAAHANYRYEILTNPSRSQSRALIELGFIILIAKRELQHGQLTSWIEDNTNVSKQWAAFARRSAEQFIDQHGESSLLLLCNPSAEAEKTDRVLAEQQMMEFTGGKGPSALLHDLGIKRRSEPPPADPMTPEELDAKLAESSWTEIVNMTADHEDDWMHLSDVQIKKINDILWPVAKAINKAAKGGA